MRKWLFLLILTVILVGCSDEDTSQEQSIEEIEKELLSLSDDIFSSLLDINWEAISEYIHEDQGLTYSPYSDVGGDDDLHFDKEAVEQLGESEELYRWYWRQNDTYYEDTPNGFIENVIKTRTDMNSPDYEMTYDQVTFDDSAYINDTQVNKIHEVYPDAHYVEYYHEPSEMEHDGKQQALRFVYKKMNGEWYLVALVRGSHNP